MGHSVINGANLEGAFRKVLADEDVIKKMAGYGNLPNFMGADEAFHFGLVNRVVPHDELMPTARAVAADIVSNG